MSPIYGMQGSQIALLLGIGLFVFVLLKRLRRGFGEPPQFRSRATAGAARAMKIGQHQESWEVEMHALARQLKGEIDTKLRALERLIQMANDARGELSASIERAESLGVLEERQLATAMIDDASSDALIPAPVGSAGSKRTNVLPRGSVSSGRLRVGETLADDPRFERVYALADAGFSATKIASQTGSQVGEVELILSLRRTQCEPM